MIPRLIENHPRRGLLTVEWIDGRRQQFGHAMLRACCPCAECRALRRAGGAPADNDTVRLVGIVAAGANAVNLAFDDGHSRGIYPFALLAGLAAAP
jgi:DUF971 family protein